MMLSICRFIVPIRCARLSAAPKTSPAARLVPETWAAMASIADDTVETESDAVRMSSTMPPTVAFCDSTVSWMVWAISLMSPMVFDTCSITATDCLVTSCIRPIWPPISWVAHRLERRSDLALRVNNRLNRSADLWLVVHGRLGVDADAAVWVTRPWLRSIDTSVRTYGAHISLSDTVQRIAIPAGLLADTRQILFVVLIDQDHEIQT